MQEVNTPRREERVCFRCLSSMKSKVVQYSRGKREGEREIEKERLHVFYSKYTTPLLNVIPLFWSACFLPLISWVAEWKLLDRSHTLLNVWHYSMTLTMTVSRLLTLFCFRRCKNVQQHPHILTKVWKKEHSEEAIIHTWNTEKWICAHDCLVIS